MTPISTRLNPQPQRNLKLGQVPPNVHTVQHASSDSFKGRQPLFGGGSQNSGSVVVEESPRPTLIENIGGLIFAIFFEKQPYAQLTELAGDKRRYDEMDDFLENNPLALPAFLEEHNLDKPYIHTALEKGNYAGALLLASHAAIINGKDIKGKRIADYINQSKDLTSEGKKRLNAHLKELYRLRTTLSLLESKAQMPTLRADIPTFVRNLPKRS